MYRTDGFITITKRAQFRKRLSISLNTHSSCVSARLKRFAIGGLDRYCWVLVEHHHGGWIAHYSPVIRASPLPLHATLMPPHLTATPPEGVEYKRTDAISPHRALSFSDLLHDGYAVAAAVAAAAAGGGGCKLI